MFTEHKKGFDWFMNWSSESYSLSPGLPRLPIPIEDALLAILAGSPLSFGESTNYGSRTLSTPWTKSTGWIIFIAILDIILELSGSGLAKLRCLVPSNPLAIWFIIDSLAMIRGAVL